MKREGRQHGMVRTHCILPSTTLSPVATLPRKTNPLPGSPPTAGVFVRVPSKPTNHSKFTGKCRRSRCSSCHLHPSSKSKDKTKGSSKHRSSEPNFGCGGISLKMDGHSSSKVLDELYDYTHLGEEEEVEVDYDDDGCCDLDERPRRSNLSISHQIETRDDNVDWNVEDDLGFYDVAIALEAFDGDEGWSLVGEM